MASIIIFIRDSVKRNLSFLKLGLFFKTFTFHSGKVVVCLGKREHRFLINLVACFAKVSLRKTKTDKEDAEARIRSISYAKGRNSPVRYNKHL
jgi:hypothetical protein